MEAARRVCVLKTTRESAWVFEILLSFFLPTYDCLMIELNIMLALIAMMMCIARHKDAVFDPFLAVVPLMLMCIGHSTMCGHRADSCHYGESAK